LEHPERTADLHLLDKQRPLGISWPVRRQPLGQVLAEALKIQVHAFDGALLHVEDVVDGDAVDPRFESAAEVELRQSRDRSNQDLLCGILRILTIPQHAESQAVDVALQRSDETIERVAVPADGLSYQLGEGVRVGGGVVSVPDYVLVETAFTIIQLALVAPLAVLSFQSWDVRDGVDASDSDSIAVP
jgi:hypothetical protein